MIDSKDEVSPISEDILALADLTEEISRRLESGDPVNGGELTDLDTNPEFQEVGP